MSNENAHFYSCQVATTNSVRQHKLRKRLAHLSEKKGQGKELISLYLPAGMSIEGVVATLKKETDSAPSRFEKSDVNERFGAALKSAIHHVKQLQNLPENGLVLFAGAPLNEDLSVEEIEPPQPVTCYIYSVDAHFNLEPLRQMLRDQKIVGILAVDAKQATFGLYKGEQIQLIDNITSGVSGKTSKGGQSQRRYERERDMALTEFFHRVAEHAAKAFLVNKVNVLIAGGPGQTKNDFLKGDYLHYELSNMLLNTVDTQSAGENALREVLDKSADLLSSMCGPEERKLIRRLMAELAKDGKLAIYGFNAVVDALQKGEVQVAIVTDNAQVAGEKDTVDALEDLASQTNASVEVISSPSPEKDALTALGGIAALLRYKSE